jgi:hypothetical protein
MFVVHVSNYTNVHLTQDFTILETLLGKVSI